MSAREQLTPQLAMVRPNLEGLPAVELPGGYRLSAYRPGFGAHWTRILSESFGEPEDKFDFDRAMRSAASYRPERVLFILHDDEPVCTASAWTSPDVAADIGIVHYLGVLNAHKGQKLGYRVSLAALHRMKAEGRTRAGLQTDDWRLPAIKTYLNLGFQPLLVHENQRERWRTVLDRLGLGELNKRFRDILDGPLWEPPKTHPDNFDYEKLLCQRKRGRIARAPGRPWQGELDTYADESLYKPSTLGTAGASVREVQAGENRPFELWFRTGPADLHEGTEVIFFVQGQRPLGTVPQTKDPTAPGFVTLSGPPDAELEAADNRNSGFRLVQGDLSEGDEVRLTVGTEHGFTWTPLAGRKEFKVIIRPGRGEPEMRLPEPVVIHVLPCDPERLELLLPGTARQGEAARATVTVRDKFDNRVPLNGSVTVEYQDEEISVPIVHGRGEVALDPSSEPARAEASTPLSLPRHAEGFINDSSRPGNLPGHRTRAVTGRADCPAYPEGDTGDDRPKDMRHTRSNYCLPTDDLQLYFGDMHAHDANSQAEGYTPDVYRWAVEDKRLDFLSVPVQDHSWLDNEKWAVAKHLAETYLDEGRFVPFLSFEWQHSHYGDKVIHYLGGNMPYLSVNDSRYKTPAFLYEALRGTDAFIISHHPGYVLDTHVPGTDWDAVQTDVDRLVELWSMHGCSEGFEPEDRPLVRARRKEGVLAGLRKGLRFGFVAGSDTHSARPGGSAKEPRPYWGGLCAVWAEALTRRSLFEAFMARRTYALTGARIAMRFSVNGDPMGSELPASRERQIAVEAWGTCRITKVQVIRDGELFAEELPGEDRFTIELEDIAQEDNATSFYYCRIVQEDGHLAVSSPVWIG